MPSRTAAVDDGWNVVEPLEGDGEKLVRMAITEVEQVHPTRDATGQAVQSHAAWTASLLCAAYQIRQRSASGFTIFWPGLQRKACSNSGMFTATPLIRYLPGECGSVSA